MIADVTVGRSARLLYCADPVAVAVGVAAVHAAEPVTNTPALPLANATGVAALACIAPVASVGVTDSPAPNSRSPLVAGGLLNTRCGLGVWATG